MEKVGKCILSGNEVTRSLFMLLFAYVQIVLETRQALVTAILTVYVDSSIVPSE